MKYVPSHSSSHCTYFVIIQMALILNCHLGCDNALKVVEPQSNVRRVITVFFPLDFKTNNEKEALLAIIISLLLGYGRAQKSAVNLSVDSSGFWMRVKNLTQMQEFRVQQEKVRIPRRCPFSSLYVELCIVAAVYACTQLVGCNHCRKKSVINQTLSVKKKLHSR